MSEFTHTVICSSVTTPKGVVAKGQGINAKMVGGDEVLKNMEGRKLIAKGAPKAEAPAAEKPADGDGKTGGGKPADK